MKKIFLIFILMFILFSSASCGPMEMPESSYEDAKLEEILKDNVTGIKSGMNRKIPLSNLNDDVENPIFDKWEAIEIYPLKEVSEDMFVYFYFNIYCEEICDALIHLTIEDEVVKYEIIKEKVIDPETGEINEIEKEVEVERYTEVINLTDEGEAVSFKNSEGNSFIYES